MKIAELQALVDRRRQLRLAIPDIPDTRENDLDASTHVTKVEWEGDGELGAARVTCSCGELAVEITPGQPLPGIGRILQSRRDCVIAAGGAAFVHQMELRSAMQPGAFELAAMARHAGALLELASVCEGIIEIVESDISFGELLLWVSKLQHNLATIHAIQAPEARLDVAVVDESLSEDDIETTAFGCPVHYGAIHGGEAEELRRGVEDLLDLEDTDLEDLRKKMRRLLDRIDARDSLGHLEHLERLQGTGSSRPAAPTTSWSNRPLQRGR